MKDQIVPKEKWNFGEEVTNVFDDMLSRSIPDYANMRKLVNSIILKHSLQDTTVLDLGCSTGGAIKQVLSLSKSNIKFIGVEISEPMIETARNELAEFINKGRVEIIKCDLREEFPEIKCSVILSVLTVQFTPIEHRQRIISKVFESLIPNGIFIFVEKILGEHAKSNELLENLYYDLKGENGYTQEQILMKRKSLEGVLVPVTSSWNEQLLYNAGFRNVQKFWQQMNFAGWVAFK